jgi:hypothetical protein
MQRKGPAGARPPQRRFVYEDVRKIYGRSAVRQGPHVYPGDEFDADDTRGDLVNVKHLGEISGVFPSFHPDPHAWLEVDVPLFDLAENRSPV